MRRMLSVSGQYLLTRSRTIDYSIKKQPGMRPVFPYHTRAVFHCKAAAVRRDSQPLGPGDKSARCHPVVTENGENTQKSSPFSEKNMKRGIAIVLSLCALVTV